MTSNQIEIYRRIESEQARLVQLDPCFQKRKIGRGNDYAGVDKLFAIDFRYDADHSIVIPVIIVHESSSQQRDEVRQNGSIATRHRHINYHISSLSGSGPS